MYGILQHQKTGRRTRHGQRIAVETTRTIDVQVLPRVRLPGMDYLPECPAVYGVLTTDEAILYIGCASLLRTYWREGHRLLQAFLDRKAEWIAWYVPGKDENRFHIERQWINRVTPPLNDQPQLGVEAEAKRQRYRAWYTEKYGRSRTGVILTIEELIQRYSTP